MPIVGDNRAGTLAACLATAPDFRLRGKAAKDIIVRRVGTIRDGWDDLCGRPD